MPRQNYLAVATGRSYRRRRKSRLASLATRKHELFPADGHAMQFLSFVQTNQTAVHVPARRELAERRSQMPARPLHTARPL